jgi:hypothetical protein
VELRRIKWGNKGQFVVRNLQAYEYIYICKSLAYKYVYIYIHLRCWDRGDCDWLGQRNEKCTMTSDLESSHLRYQGETEEYVVIYTYVKEISFEDAN